MADLPTRDCLKQLGHRRDQPGLGHLVIQSGAFLAAAVATSYLSAAQNAAVWGASLSLGVCVLVFFPLLHEAGHQTAFKSARLNEVGVWLGALMMLQAPTFFREFHWEHHRSTGDPELDPEISGAPALLEDWPRNPFTYVFLISQHLLVGKFGFTLLCAAAPASIWTRVFPFIRVDRQRRVAWESRFVIVLLSAIAGLGFWTIPGFGMILLAWPIAHLFLGLYLMAEHTGLGREGDQIERTRTVRTNAFLRWLMWNMPYHAEHHAYPGIPYHALPALHDVLEPNLRHQSPGYIRFQLDAAMRAIRIR